jgi:hypothetical protein
VQNIIFTKIKRLSPDNEKGLCNIFVANLDNPPFNLFLFLQPFAKANKYPKENTFATWRQMRYSNGKNFR